ncbi:hypothetical protein PYCCODRAFT_1429722 [Trametes coccinea BRFM310]|uniref:FYVE-type domain-containing protein n=1 Tax=Trametes coccinea (strain BRFM310) TaxID=1353009 RepID=A0A1Y2J5G7_TRAC3|nr:hypothetical protein PYCCODRAFT_1429722 [Trametes coccinea BRFM310]
MDNPPYVPYQAYKPKRHSRGLSSQQSGLASAPLPVQPRPSATFSNGHTYSEPVVAHAADGVADAEKRPMAMPNGRGTLQRPVSMIDTLMPPRQDPSPAPRHHLSSASVDKPLPAPAHVLLQELHDLRQSELTPKSPSPVASSADVSPPAASPPPVTTPPSPAVTLPSSPRSQASQVSSPKLNGKAIAQSSPVAGPSSLSPAAAERPVSSSRKSSTFRHIRPPSAKPPMQSSPLRPASAHARTSSALLSSPRPTESRLHEPASGVSSAASTPNMAAHDRALPPIPTFDLHLQTPSSRPSTQAPSPAPSVPPPGPSGPPPRTSSLMMSPTQQPVTLPHVASSPALTPSTSVSSTVTGASVKPARSPAPYRPGFQPKGVYRPRTDEFIEARNHSRDVGRIERTRLERRLEKLINLHFPPPGQKKEESSEHRPTPQNRRASSFWDLDFSELKSKSAGDLWREVIQSQSQGGKNDIRAAEQKITPWEDDAAVSQCPLCSASFHPLTNRKHHCRLCGRIICSLPVKYPQRPQPCSLLFVVDQSTGRIEEVGEGVDYGVRRRTPSNAGKAGKKGEVMSEEEKFLKGVRICRDCKPVLLRQQYRQDMVTVPLFSRLYDAFISLEKEIEDELPIFQELMISLSKQERPAPEASAARKRLLEAFAQYDALAKRIRKLPCAPGSSQDRVQNAILTRANLFLQKHMFPLQSLPKPKKSSSAAASPSTPAPPEDQIIDPDSEVARVLQPLLEQEALLETFVEEAKAHRKFEDVKTLKNNLREIRAEIERILANAEEQASSRPRARTSSA